MTKHIKIKKGLDIQLLGEANKSINSVENDLFAIKPTDFIDIKPRLMIEIGDEIKAGQPVFHDKYREELLFCSPVSGTISDIVRGEKRIIKEVIIKSNKKAESIDFKEQNIEKINKEEIVNILEKSGMWSYLIQRPFGTIANKNDNPKAIVVSAFDTAPLAPDMDFIVHGKGDCFQAGLDILKKLTTGKIHLNVHDEKTTSKVFLNSKNVQINSFSGSHPCGNVGIQIHHLDPINKGEVIWTIKPEEIISIGKLFLKGEYDVSRIVAVCGSEVNNPAYHKIILGSNISNLIKNNTKSDNIRYISGNVLTGTKIEKDGFISYHDNQITLIPEGNYYEFMAWTMPGLKKFSFSNTFISKLFSKRKYALDTNIHGGKRSFIFSGYYDKVLPMNILPLQLLKAIQIEDIDKMEQLGIYEVSEEDFALIEFIDPSKSDIQKIIRKGLDLIKAEI